MLPSSKTHAPRPMSPRTIPIIAIQPLTGSIISSIQLPTDITASFTVSQISSKDDLKREKRDRELNEYDPEEDDRLLELYDVEVVL